MWRGRRWSKENEEIYEDEKLSVEHLGSSILSRGGQCAVLFKNIAGNKDLNKNNISAAKHFLKNKKIECLYASITKIYYFGSHKNFKLFWSTIRFN